MNHIFDVIRQYDYQVYYYFYDLGNRSEIIDFFFYFFARYGIIFSFLSFIYLIIKKKIPAFLCTLFAMGVAGALDFIVYIFWQRPRPFITHNLILKPEAINLYTDPSSFPSSHTYITFAIATSIFLYGHKRLGLLLFFLAVLSAIGRIGVGIHYPSDIIGGALLGIISGIFVKKLFCHWEYLRTSA